MAETFALVGALVVVIAIALSVIAVGIRVWLKQLDIRE